MYLYESATAKNVIAAFLARIWAFLLRDGLKTKHQSGSVVHREDLTIEGVQVLSDAWESSLAMT
jgi:hypothetical protein